MPNRTALAPVKPLPVIVTVDPSMPVAGVMPVTMGWDDQVQSSAVAGCAVLGRPVELTTVMSAVVPCAPVGVIGTVT